MKREKDSRDALKSKDRPPRTKCHECNKFLSRRDLIEFKGKFYCLVCHGFLNI